MSSIDKVTVLGMGVLGSQIAFQSALKGKQVTTWDISDDAVLAGRGKFDVLVTRYAQDLPEVTEEMAREAANSIVSTSDLAAAIAEADLVIEAVPEKLEIKQGLYAQMAPLANPATIFATNSSTLLPSDIAPSTGDPSRFLALHFANEIWLHPTAEVMPHAGTDLALVPLVAEFAREIGMVPIEMHKEKAGYVLNSLLVPLLDAAGELWAGGYADPETVDLTWKLATGAPAGPFQIFDIVGLTTAYNISASSADPKKQAFAALLKEKFIDAGKLGVATGEGFYTYK